MEKLLLFAILSVTFLNIQAQDTATSPDVWKTYSKEDYTIQYPSSWELNESGMMGTSFIFLSPPDGPNDNFRENVNMVTQSLQGQKITMDQFVELTKNQLKVLITGVNILYEERKEKEGLEYHKIIYTGTQGTLNLKLEQYYFLANDSIYSLTLTCTIVDFDDYQEIGEKIMDSFELK